MTTSIYILLFSVFGASPNTAVGPCLNHLATKPQCRYQEEFRSCKEELVSYLCFSKTNDNWYS